MIQERIKDVAWQDFYIALAIVGLIALSVINVTNAVKELELEQRVTEASIQKVHEKRVKEYCEEKKPVGGDCKQT